LGYIPIYGNLQYTTFVFYQDEQNDELQFDQLSLIRS